MEHDLRHCAGEKDLHGGEVLRSVGERIDEARHLAIDFGPFGGGGALQSRGVGDGGNMEQKVCRSTKGGMNDHRVSDCGLREDLVSADAELMQAENGAGLAARGIKPDGLA